MGCVSFYVGMRREWRLFCMQRTTGTEIWQDKSHVAQIWVNHISNSVARKAHMEIVAFLSWGYDSRRLAAPTQSFG
jgi:hypothetical protein